MPNSVKPASLAAQNAAIGYAKTTIVEGLDLAIAEKRFTALVGPNGSGKSTILRALAGHLQPSRGAILLDGQSIASLPAKQIGRRIGSLAQTHVTPDGLTVRDLVEQGRYPHRSFFGLWSETDEEACRRALEITGMQSLSDRLLDTLSGGQRQRAWIAMTLAQETGILLLDEPTTYLDLAHQIEVLDLLRQLIAERGTTIVAVLHDLNQAARYADCVTVLKEGAVVASGNARDVVTPKLIRDVFGVDCVIIDDPTNGAPLCVPVPGTAISRP